MPHLFSASGAIALVSLGCWLGRYHFVGNNEVIVDFLSFWGTLSPVSVDKASDNVSVAVFPVFLPIHVSEVLISEAGWS